MKFITNFNVMKMNKKIVFNRKRNDLIFVVKEIRIISSEKKFSNGVDKCNDILIKINSLDNISDNKELYELENKIFLIIDELKFIIDIEKRFVLFPLPDIKKEAFEMGKKYMDNFLEWTLHEDSFDSIPTNYTSEEIIKILEEELFRLDELQEVLNKISQ